MSPSAFSTQRPARSWWLLVVACIIVTLLATPPGREVAGHFFTSLRLPPPTQVAATEPAAPGTASTRQLQDLVAEMISPTVTVALDEHDQAVPSSAAAHALTDFPIRLPAARTDAPTLTVLGARTLNATVNRAQLRTIFVESGKGAISLPGSVNGTPVVISSPRGVRATFGSCPAVPTSTLQNQLQGAPPLPADVRSCVILTESPKVTATVPRELDMQQLTEIALELSGLSPRQTRSFQDRMDWQSTLTISLPRGARSFDSVTVQGTPAMLFTGGRRGATYSLVWTDHGMAYTLTGFGNPTDAVTIASSLH